jgi:acyl dehydratase
MLNLSELQIDMNLPEVKKIVSQQDINAYAQASHDFNPIHINEEFARNTPMGGTIAHGMLILSFLSQMMSDSFGKHWLTGGKLNVKFKLPVRPGSEVTASGKISKIVDDEGVRTVTCKVQCAEQAGGIAISGDAIVRIKKD